MPVEYFGQDVPEAVGYKTRTQGRDSESKMETQQPPAGHRHPDVWNLDPPETVASSRLPRGASRDCQQWWEAEQVVVDSDALVPSSRLPSSAPFSESRGAHLRAQLLLILCYVVSFLSRGRKKKNG